MLANDIVFVFEGALAPLAVVADVPDSGLTDEIQAVEVMQPFNIGWVAAAVLCFDLNGVLV